MTTTTTTTTTGTGEAQGRLWSVNAADWAELQEPHVSPAYVAVLDALVVGRGTRLLDIGCGAGGALRLAADRGADVTGIDAAPALLGIARARVPGANLVRGELQSLPFADASFDAVTGFNSFQYAADPPTALNEARRVTRPGGRIVALVWSPKEMCGLAPHVESLGRLMPPPPPNAPGPFALSGRDALEELFATAGLTVAEVKDVPCTFTYPDRPTALAALCSAGPIVRVAEHAGQQAVEDDIRAFLAPHERADGSYAIENPFRYAMSDPVRIV